MSEAEIRTNILKAARSLTMLWLTYDGLTRYVEPYEFDGPYFWGYCWAHNSIHRFMVSKIDAATVTERNFSPRWPIQIG